MTKLDLLNSLCEFTRTAVGDIIMPVRKQKENSGVEPASRAAEVYRMRLPDSTAAKKKAPYIIHQIVTGKDSQRPDNHIMARTVIRSVFCVYNDNEEEGGLMLLNLMERLRISLLRQVALENRYQLDLEVGLESLIYPENTAPYYVGEIHSTWKLPAIKKEVQLYGKNQ